MRPLPYSNLKPGGWVELQDVDGAVHCDDDTLPADWPVLVFCNLMVEAFAKLGTTAHAAMFGGKYLEEAGFVNIQHHTAKLPYGTWPKDRLVPNPRLVPGAAFDLSPSKLVRRPTTNTANPELRRTMRLVGLYYRTAAEEFFPAAGAIQMPLLGWSKVLSVSNPSLSIFHWRCKLTLVSPQEEMEVFFAQCRSAMRDESVHAYGLMHFWSGQKPG